MIWLAAALLLYLAILLAVVRVSMFPPRIPIFLSPAAFGAPQEEVEFSSEDGAVLRGWWVAAADPKGVAVFAHGYVMNRAELAPVAHRLWQEGISCLLFDFRAHGRSEARKSTMGPMERLDALAAARFARARARGMKLVLIGSSMGAAASALALADDPSIAEGLVLDSSYSRLASASLGWWRFLGGTPLSLILAPSVLAAWPFIGFNPFKVDVSRALAKLGRTPMLFMHGKNDDLALPREALRNYAAAAGPKQIVWFDSCGHSEGRWLIPALYERSLLDFLAEVGMLAADPQLNGDTSGHGGTSTQ